MTDEVNKTAAEMFSCEHGYTLRRLNLKTNETPDNARDGIFGEYSIEAGSLLGKPPRARRVA